jgi:hypothetical protein
LKVESEDKSGMARFRNAETLKVEIKTEGRMANAE